MIKFIIGFLYLPASVLISAGALLLIGKFPLVAGIGMFLTLCILLGIAY